MSNTQRQRLLAAALVGASTLSGAELAAKESEMSSTDTQAAHAWAGKDNTEQQAMPDIYEWSKPQRDRYIERAQNRLDQSFARLKPAAIEVCAEETGGNPTACEHLLNNTKATVRPFFDHPKRNTLGAMSVRHGNIRKNEPSKIEADARFVNEASTKALDAVVSHEIGHIIQTLPGARGHEEQKTLIHMEPRERQRPEHLAKHHQKEASADMLGGRIARATGVPKNGLKDAWKTIFSLEHRNITDMMSRVYLPGGAEKTIKLRVNETFTEIERNAKSSCGRADRLNTTSDTPSVAGRYPCIEDRNRLFAGEIPKGYESLAGPTRKRGFLDKLKDLFNPTPEPANATAAGLSAVNATHSQGATIGRATSEMHRETTVLSSSFGKKIVTRGKKPIKIGGAMSGTEIDREKRKTKDEGRGR